MLDRFKFLRRNDSKSNISTTSKTPLVSSTNTSPAPAPKPKPVSPPRFPLPDGGVAFFKGFVDMESSEEVWKEELARHADKDWRKKEEPIFAIFRFAELHLRIVDKGYKGTPEITAVVVGKQEAERFRRASGQGLHAPIATLMDDEILDAGVFKGKDPEKVWRMSGLMRIIEGRWETEAEHLFASSHLGELHKAGRHRFLPLRARNVECFFCEGKMVLVYFEARPMHRPLTQPNLPRIDSLSISAGDKETKDEHSTKDEDGVLVNVDSFEKLE